jgi:hypothetical protein
MLTTQREKLSFRKIFTRRRVMKRRTRFLEWIMRIKGCLMRFELNN